MPQSRVTILPLTDYPTGTYSLLEASLPVWVLSATFELARSTSAAPTIWPNPATTIAVDTEVSLDGGQTWTYSGGFSSFGGIHVRHDGTEAATSFGTATFPLSIDRRVRGTVKVINGPIRTAMTLQLDG